MSDMWEPPFFPGLFFIILSPMYAVLIYLSSFNPIVCLFGAVVFCGAYLSVKEICKGDDQ